MRTMLLIKAARRATYEKGASCTGGSEDSGQRLACAPSPASLAAVKLRPFRGGRIV